MHRAQTYKQAYAHVIEQAWTVVLTSHLTCSGGLVSRLAATSGRSLMVFRLLFPSKSPVYRSLGSGRCFPGDMLGIVDRAGISATSSSSKNVKSSGPNILFELTVLLGVTGLEAAAVLWLESWPCMELRLGLALEARCEDGTRSVLLELARIWDDLG
eukprot:1181896-Prorocentrum_minimum.AAC.1